MLLQRTGWHIKQFISHRRSTSVERNEHVEDIPTDKNSSTVKSLVSDPKRLSWISQSSARNVRQHRRVSSSATIESRSTPPINYTARSSASSLCSCECAANPRPSNTSLSSFTSPRIEPRLEIIYLPSLSSTSSGDAKAWQLIFPEEISCPHPDAAYSQQVGTKSSTFNLLEALTLDPADGDKTPTQSMRNSEERDLDTLEDNMENLIRETDKAFQAVGTALSDAKDATLGWRQETVSEPNNRRISVQRGVARKETKSTIVRTQSVAKAKKKTFGRKKNLPSQVLKTPEHPIKRHARWTLTDVTTNVVDIFSSMIFKIEADEMLTPDRLHQLKLEEKREIDGQLRHGETTENEHRMSIESGRSTDTDGSTPTEPFHLESLSSRLTTVTLDRPIAPAHPSPALPPPTIPQPQQRRRSPTKEALIALKAGNVIGDSEMETWALKYPSSIRHHRATSHPTPPLPTIPEVSPLTFMAPKSRYGRYRERQFSFDSLHPPPDYILLPSTFFTLTCPTFEHGPIRIERKELEPLPDEVLDWTAFQMAISGKMNEIGNDERDDIERAADKVEIDEVSDWWSGYKLPGYGQLIRGEPSTMENATITTATKMERIGILSRSGTDKIVVEGAAQDGPAELAKDGHLQSMPPSPMLDVVTASPTKIDELVPMGFNLGHDLGDFLDWETKYVRKYCVND